MKSLQPYSREHDRFTATDAIAGYDAVVAGARQGTVLVATMFQTCRSESPTGQVRENSASAIPSFNAAVSWPH